jgi:hypothetical protein
MIDNLNAGEADAFGRCFAGAASQLLLRHHGIPEVERLILLWRTADLPAQVINACFEWKSGPGRMRQC